MKAVENRLLILSEEAAEYRKGIDLAGLQHLQVLTATGDSSSVAKLRDCNIVLGDPPLISKILDDLPNLQWVQSGWAGVDSLCKPGLRRDYLLTGIKGVFGPLISEYIMTYLFAFERRVFAMRSNQLNQIWQPFQYRPAREITMGIAGLGSIGRHLVQTAKHFGIRVIGLNRSGKPCVDVREVYTPDACHGFFEQSDYVVISLPGTRQTEHFINDEELRMMRPSAVLMNVGRGSVVNEADLIKALQQGMIGGALLDVFEKEPLPSESPLWKMENVFITPHNSATSFATDVVATFIANYQRFLQGKSLFHEIDTEAGY